jgi:hypothetical protein
MISYIDCRMAAKMRFHQIYSFGDVSFVTYVIYGGADFNHHGVNVFAITWLGVIRPDLIKRATRALSFTMLVSHVS